MVRVSLLNHTIGHREYRVWSSKKWWVMTLRESGVFTREIVVANKPQESRDLDLLFSKIYTFVMFRSI